MYVPLLNHNHIFQSNTLSRRENLGKDHKRMHAAFHLFYVLIDLWWQLTVLVIFIDVLILSISFSLGT